MAPKVDDFVEVVIRRSVLVVKTVYSQLFVWAFVP